MKYYTYDPENIIFNIAKKNLAFSSVCKNNTSIDELEPMVLTPKTIKLLVSWLKQEKNNFKNFINNFKKLDIAEKLTLMKKYYKLSDEKLKQFQLEAYKKEYPITKTIKTNIFDSVFHTDTGETGYFRTKYTVFAKPNVKLSTLKRYSQEELTKLIADKQIVVISSELYGFEKASAKRGSFFPQPILAHEFCEDVFDEDTIKTLQIKNPKALKELILSIDPKELHDNYTQEYLPAYKKMLDYFVKCAKVTVAQNEANKKNMQKQIAQANEQNREMEDVTKFIIDTSKGR